ncbi:GTPase IMAP family member 2-like [Cyprinodon tularosa]|uniref:GTPase IMAP family member 2-like n=1 Tax=Cyprinodon tularosa TaxID=77115 RepID=UPI0018E2105F|nr:GTPase IMAP family member 2-like [Cyprinodon tularosa]
MRLILLGNNWSDKSSVSNLLLGPNMCNKTEDPKTSSKILGRIKTTKTVLINTPNLLNPTISEDKLKEHVEHCVSLCAPGPHVFLLVVQHNITDQQKKKLCKILELFSDEAFKCSLVLISKPGWETSAPNYSSHQRPLQDLITTCGENWVRLQNNPEGLLLKLTLILRKSNGDHIVCGRPSLEPVKETHSHLDSSSHEDNLINDRQNSSPEFLPSKLQQWPPPVQTPAKETKKPEPSSSQKPLKSKWEALYAVTGSGIVVSSPVL